MEVFYALLEIFLPFPSQRLGVLSRLAKKRIECGLFFSRRGDRPLFFRQSPSFSFRRHSRLRVAFFFLELRLLFFLLELFFFLPLRPWRVRLCEAGRLRRPGDETPLFFALCRCSFLGLFIQDERAGAPEGNFFLFTCCSPLPFFSFICGPNFFPSFSWRPSLSYQRTAAGRDFFFFFFPR